MSVNMKLEPVIQMSFHEKNILRLQQLVVVFM